MAEAIVLMLQEGAIDTFSFTEFLINCQGGFVRRGLTGEILLAFCKFISPESGGLDYKVLMAVITVVSIIALGSIWWWFARRFREKGLSWWFLASPFVIGSVTGFIRKDFLLYLLLIAILLLLQPSRGAPNNCQPEPGVTPIYRRIFAIIITVVALWLHEAFIFWGGAVLALILMQAFRKDSPIHNQRWLNAALLVIPFGVFMYLCVHKGTPQTALAVVGSWNDVLCDSPLTPGAYNSIGALGWDLKETIMMHLEKNIAFNGFGLLFTPLIAIAVFYLLSNFLTVFCPRRAQFTPESSLAISLLYSTMMLTLLPMLTILSCDQLRVFQCAGVTTIAFFLIYPAEKIIVLFPTWWVRAIKRFSDMLRCIVPPGKGVLLLLLLFIGISEDQFSLDACFNQSIIGCLWRAALYLFFPSGNIWI